jgi:methylated-DNA-[protein]-cysteine S-methyltransferase
MMELAWASLATPVGPVGVGCSGSGVAQTRFGGPPGLSDGQAPEHTQLNIARTQLSSACTQLSSACTQLAEYFSGRRRVFELAVDWAAMSGPQRLVLGLLHCEVGYGQTVTYGGLARHAGLAGDGSEPPARMVGRIMGSNPIPLIVPCHRVVAGDGLGGYSGGTGLEVKRWLLILEGALPPTLDWSPAGPPG